MGESSSRFWIVFCVMLLVFALCAMMSVFEVTRAHAEMLCAQFDQLKATLKEHNHEAPVAAGIGQKGAAAVTLFTSPNGETWTLAVVDQTGKSCVIGTGQGWTNFAPLKGEPT